MIKLSIARVGTIKKYKMDTNHRIKKLKDVGWEESGYALGKMYLEMKSGELPPRIIELDVDHMDHEHFLECIEDGLEELKRRKQYGTYRGL